MCDYRLTSLVRRGLVLGNVAVPRLLDGLLRFWKWLASLVGIAGVIIGITDIWSNYDIARRDDVPNIEVVQTGLGLVNDRNTRDINDIAVRFHNKGKKNATDIVIRVGTVDQPKQEVKLLAETTLPYLEAGSSKTADLRNRSTFGHYIVSCISYHNGSDAKKSPVAVYPVPDNSSLLLQRGQWVPLEPVFNEADVLAPRFSCEQMRAG
jgi:hypothetical protein